jgi:hypothetical protein
MKIARTFTIDYDLAVELQKRPNQSLTVSKALRNYLDYDGNLFLRDASTIRLVKELSTRDDIDNTLRNICELILSNGL